MAITEQSYEDAAKMLGCETNVIKAVAAVESRGAGFLPTGEVKILFEPHVFWDQLKKGGKNPGLILQQQPDLKDVLYQKWKTYPYGKNSEQWDRLRKAAQIDIAAAHKSASYGKFQIMGFNHRDSGFVNIFEFTHAMQKNEGEHLKAFVQLIKYKALDKILQKKDWTTFAKKYNGAGYHQNTPTLLDDYDYKLKAMYNKLK